MSDAPKSVSLSIVVPCSNDVPGMSLLLPRLHDVCRSLTSSYEILLIDDGASEEISRLAQQALEEFPNLAHVRLARTFGKNALYAAGVALSGGEMVLFIPSDLRDPPELLPDMVHLLENGAEAVFGHPQKRASDEECFLTNLWDGLICNKFDNDQPICLFGKKAMGLLKKSAFKNRSLFNQCTRLKLVNRQFPYIRLCTTTNQNGAQKHSLLRALDERFCLSTTPLRLCFGLCVLSVGLALTGEALALVFAPMLGLLLLLLGAQAVVGAILCVFVGRLYFEGKEKSLFALDKIDRKG